jgi:hypothetical protein
MSTNTNPSEELERLAKLAEDSEKLILKVSERIISMNRDLAVYSPLALDVVKLSLKKVPPIRRAQALRVIFEELKPYMEGV